MPRFDPDDTATYRSAWWNEIGDEGPKPYSTAAWTYHQTVEEEDTDETEEDPGSEDYLDELPWWETIGNEGPKPYATAAWTYHQEVVNEDEFVRLSRLAFKVYDEWLYPRLDGLGIVLNAGYFEDTREEIYDSGFYLDGERGLYMKRKLACVLVYDQLADSPGLIPIIPQPLGALSTDPNFGDPLETDPAGYGVGAELNNAFWAQLAGDTGPLQSLEISGDGDLDGVVIEAARASVQSDDRPPGAMLGSVSYELLDTTVTITSWEHLNWQDDTPVYKAVKVILNELPQCVTEIKVLDPPHAFWTALGFRPNYKGDQYLHLYRV